ncbi:MAG: hypothetical protein K9G60_17135 [Pseudolabrys sp.]|nr:hypothetical protein [Pseudolabrys sp.]
MLVSFARIAFLGLALSAGSQAVFAGDLADFNAAVEKAASHNRGAIGYLRTDNTDLASLELDRLRDAWKALNTRFAGKPPDAFDGNALYGKTLVDVSARLVAADMMLNSGRAAAARQSLNAIRSDLYELRKASGIVVLADCVQDANAAADAIMAYNKKDLDWSKPATRFGIASTASIYGYVLTRCDGIASAIVRNSPEFRRLVDGSKAGLDLIPKAIATRDSNLLHRILIELRSFDNLLAFRFG